MRINKDQIEFSKWESLKFSYKRAKGHFIPYIVNRLQWYYYPPSHIVAPFPPHVDIDVSTVCNMKCPMCYTSTETFKGHVGKGFMSFDTYKKIIDECAHNKLYSIRLCARGEPFLNKDIIKMITYAKDKGIKEISMISNILGLPPSLFKQAMEGGLSWLSISFDGLGRTYESIRRPAKFDEAFEKIKEYKKIKEKAGSLKPVVKVQSVWPAVKDCVDEYIDTFSPYVDMIAFNPLMDQLVMDEEPEHIENFDCHVLYQRLAVAIDGKVKFCVHDNFSSCFLGDVNKQSIYELWHGKQLNDIRELHKKHVAVKEIKACKHCHHSRKVTPVLQKFKEKEIYIDQYIDRSQRLGT